MEKVRIEIPKVDEREIVNIPKGQIGVLKDHFDKQFNKIDKLLFAIVTSVVVSVAAVIVAVVGIFIDQLRYNNAAYKDYSSKLESTEKTQQINKELLDQNQINQQMIVEQEKQIQQLIKKK